MKLELMTNTSALSRYIRWREVLQGSMRNVGAEKEGEEREVFEDGKDR